ncbi:MAG: choice-of-anchor A family protein [Phycisphaerae bacterium]|nr:choice-of-anchor A family protein [Phycisphaerae bacterium]
MSLHIKNSVVVAFVLSIALPAVAAFASTLAPPLADPFGYFNVYSLKDIGTSNSPYTSDYQGIAGAAGNASFNTFSLADVDTRPYSLHAGGNIQLGGGTYHGNVEALGNAVLPGGGSIFGDLTVGANATASGGGTISGAVVAGGTANFSPSYTVSGGITQHATINPVLDAGDYNDISQFFLDTSASIGAAAPTGVVVDKYGELILNASSGVNVFNIDADEYYGAWGATVNGPADAIVWVNIIGTSVNLDWTDWVYNGVGAGNVLLNFPDATSINFDGGGHAVNTLAPLADVSFPYGLITGNLIVGDLQGGGQVNLGFYDHGGEVPEPATLILLGVGSIGVILKRKRQRIR